MEISHSILNAKTNQFNLGVFWKCTQATICSICAVLHSQNENNEHDFHIHLWIMIFSLLFAIIQMSYYHHSNIKTVLCLIKCLCQWMNVAMETFFVEFSQDWYMYMYFVPKTSWCSLRMFWNAFKHHFFYILCGFT